MTKKADTWMPLYVGEYLADTTNLNTEQHGAYCLMLMAAWKRGGTLPNDDSQLASITKLSPGRWKAHRAILVDFFEAKDDTLIHERVTHERIKAQAISEGKKESGAAGAAARWNIDDEKMPDALASAMPNAIANAITHAVANGVANESQTDAPSPSPLPITTVAKATVSAKPTIPHCPHVVLIDLFGKHLPELPQPKPELWDGKNAQAMRSRWKWLLTATKRSGERYATTEAEAVDWFDRFFGYVAKSDFLTGRSGRWMNCDLGWLMNQSNFAKVVQGNYENKEAAHAPR
ncbi:MAG: DUF1376 domain-containing protein [Proteobacteria bacterium]|nr:DUF1376 domain-containing protein [Pseudomonadota bacterium]